MCGTKRMNGTDKLNLMLRCMNSLRPTERLSVSLRCADRVSGLRTMTSRVGGLTISSRRFRSTLQFCAGTRVSTVDRSKHRLVQTELLHVPYVASAGAGFHDTRGWHCSKTLKIGSQRDGGLVRVRSVRGYRWVLGGIALRIRRAS